LPGGMRPTVVKRLAVAVAVAVAGVVLGASACSSATPSTAAGRSGGSPVAAAASAPAATSAASTASAATAAVVCAAALAGLPSAPPPGERQAGTDSAKLGHPAGSTAAFLVSTVATDDVNIGLDYLDNGPIEADLAKWKADAAALRAYCAGQH